MDVRRRAAGSVVAIVANAPADHGDAARALLEAGVPTLVEKPFTLDHQEAAALVELSATRAVPLLVDHELLLATYLHQVHHLRGAGAADADLVELEWHDVERELRHGVLKSPDPTVSVVADLLPHALSAVRVVLGSAPFELTAVTSSDGGRSASVALRCGDTPVAISLDRRAANARRRLLVRSGDDDHIVLDFTREPGDLVVNGRPAPADGRWDREPRPLTAAFHQLIDAANQAAQWSPLDAAANLDLLATTLAAEQALRSSAFDHLAEAIASGRDSGAHRHVITQELARDLIRSGAVDGPGDTSGLDLLGAAAYDLVARQANDPFVTQEALLADQRLDRASARRLGAAIRRSQLCQRLLTSGGRGRKYVANTMLPALRSGAIDAVVQKRTVLPFRIGLYPGQSCMFNCSFCGRNPTAAYLAGSVDPGTRRFEQLLHQVGADDPYRFYLSGGLEPLTNRFVGRLAEAGAEAGHALSLYTNGFMLTPALLRRQPGLWHLRSLRISLYGVDQVTSSEVTGRSSSFPRVRANAVELLRGRDRTGSDLQIGFNFVVLPGQVSQVLRLVELIGEMNRESGGRPVDFLTLREDFSVGPDQGLGPADREQLRDLFDLVEARCAEPDLAGLTIDYGYSLDALRRGVVGEQLRMVSADSMRPHAHPQVSVVIDLLGDVYAYREAGFLDRPGADRYRLGRIDDDHSLSDVIGDWLAGPGATPRPGDECYLDIFDHVIALTVAQADQDLRFGSPLGPNLVADYGPAEQPSPAHFENAHFAEVAR
ncbi:MAG: Gfo/Idh/MocA family oxidoreductase [Acidimicrobiales bacterium]